MCLIKLVVTKSLGDRVAVVSVAGAASSTCSILSNKAFSLAN